MVGDDSSDLNLWLRPKLPSYMIQLSVMVNVTMIGQLTLEEGCLGGRDEALLGLEGGDGVELAESSESL